MKKKSFTQQWRDLSWFWKLIYTIVLLCMPWTVILIIAGFWHMGDRIYYLEESIGEFEK